MGYIASGISMSLDGFVTGPGPTRDRPLGERGEVLHRWLDEPMAPSDRVHLAGMRGRTGAVVMGRNGYAPYEGTAAGPLGTTPCVVLTHSPPKPDEVGAPELFTFVTGGIAEALERAGELAGGKDVVLHGASPVQQALRAGLVDELYVSLTPVILGSGTRLFDNLEGVHVQLERLQVVMSPGVTHLRFQVRR
ncbi:MULTISPECIES: dihydrofolate reductase family protein [Streptomyces]|uniref:Riboflavin biosynthesis protein n=4 Tax=Streptomyces TaxID=1883 RepID=A0A8H9HWM1_9ACTN|nr:MULTISPECIES: dihydrofolate reductase family protein [Streptomyces]NEE31342.1 riboflavin biosynthesis protein RibD [Streptomyces sp. SID7982]NEE48312.1 riboflavin biosynthesis protein RibD [Streptomyces sp. SID8455]MDQ0294321.1 dihydrofolate reductase [Streptomyces sp. DSM 41037]PJM80591.1 riboflavin biosynthesis protein RibD [Streptomyces sp. TSRI0384-2]QNE81722.1 riboflavin biosynthesis protein RibD [Streptomyces rutgersensis]